MTSTDACKSDKRPEIVELIDRLSMSSLEVLDLSSHIEDRLRRVSHEFDQRPTCIEKQEEVQEPTSYTDKLHIILSSLNKSIENYKSIINRLDKVI